MMPPSELLEALRRETRTQHHAVEEKLHLLDGRLTRERYTRVLEAFFEFYSNLSERWRSEAPELPWRPDFEEKIEALRRDLQVLGREPIASSPRGDSAHLGPGW